METGESGFDKAQTYGEAKKLLDEAWQRSAKVYKEAKEQADIIHEAAKKLAVDKEARQRADEAHDEALKEAKKVRDAITNVAQAVFTESWMRRDAEAKDALAMTKEQDNRAQKAFNEAKEQADTTHREATGRAVDKQARQEADEAHNEAVKRAKKTYDER